MINDDGGDVVLAKGTYIGDDKRLINKQAWLMADPGCGIVLARFDDVALPESRCWTSFNEKDFFMMIAVEKEAHHEAH